MENLVQMVGVVIPMLTIAGSAVAFVLKAFQDSRERKEQRLFELMKIIDENGTIASKVMAVYQLRQFPKHREFIIRFCDSQQTNVTGLAAPALIKEMQRTSEFYSIGK